MNRRPRLPLRITLLLGLVLITTVLSAVRFLTAISWSSTLQNYTSSTLVTYVAITGVFWTIAGGFVLWSFWRRTRYVRWVLVGTTTAYTLWAWIDRLLVQIGPHTNWPFALVATIVLLGYAAAVVLDPHNRAYFRKENHD